MSMTVAQIYATNPTTVVSDTDLYYLVQSPYTPGADAAISGASLKAAFGSGGTINPGLINQLGYYAAAGSTISGLATLASGTLITSAGGTPSISQTLPATVQGNITALGTIATGVWNGSVITGTFGGTGVNNGASTITIGGNFAMSGAFSFTGTLTGVTGVTFPTTGTLATIAQLPTPSALTKTDDTNVTLSLGGSPTVALLAATSLTLGWTGVLSGTRGGTGVNNGANTITLGGSLTTSGAFASTFTMTGITTVTFPTTGTLATTAQIPTGAALTKTDDTNVTLTLGGSPTTALVNAASLTLGWTGQLGLTRGGTAASLTASNGGIVYSNASTLAILSGTATAQQLLMSGASTTPQWSTTTYPLTNAINTLLYASSANVMSALATANNGVLITSSGGVPSISSTLPSGITLVAPVLGTPASGTLTNATGYTVANLADVAWTDFSGTIGYTGFSGTPTTTAARYKKVGRIVFIQLNMSGTSNATGFTVTNLPFTSGAVAQLSGLISMTNNSATVFTANINIGAGGTTATMLLSNNGAGWTSSGTKGVFGMFFYESST